MIAEKRDNGACGITISCLGKWRHMLISTHTIRPTKCRTETCLQVCLLSRGWCYLYFPFPINLCSHLISHDTTYLHEASINVEMIWRWTNSVATQQGTKPLQPSATFSLNCCFMSKLWRFSDNDKLRERQQSRVSANHVSTMCSTRDTRLLQCTFWQLAANEWLLDTMHQTAELHQCLFQGSCRIASFISCWEKHCSPASILSQWAILFLSLLCHTTKNAGFYEAAYVIMKSYRNWTDWLQFPRQCL